MNNLNVLYLMAHENEVNKLFKYRNFGNSEYLPVTQTMQNQVSAIQTSLNRIECSEKVISHSLLCLWHTWHVQAQQSC